ncbi:MAG: M15 family metallopeptidase [Actinomycetota bacterium]
MSRRLLGRSLAAVIVVAVGATTAVAVDGPGELVGPATATEPAERALPEVTDVVTVHDSGPLDAETRYRAINAADAADATWSVVQTVSSAMTQIRRGDQIVQAAPSSFSFPMSTTFLADDAISTLMGAQVLDGLSDQTLVMSARTAGLRGAQSGDIVTLRHVAGGTRDFRITQIVDDAITGGTELLMLPSAAARLGVARESRVIMWGFADRDAIMQALTAAGVTASPGVGPGAIFDPPGSPKPIRLRRSWDPRDPDGTLGMAQTKELLGEFAYRVNGDGSVSIDSAWINASLPVSEFGFIQKRNYATGIRAACHNGIHEPLAAALAEIAARGLAGTIDVGDANLAGGCYNPRFNRLAPNSNVGFLSRHTWAMAIDTNTRSACQGCNPPSFATRSGGCDTVRIFRKYGFSWGGAYTTPDGMHFEYVGEDRSQIPYPSRWCANQPSGGALTAEFEGDPSLDPSLEWSERSVMFADAGLIDGHSHD